MKDRYIVVETYHRRGQLEFFRRYQNPFYGVTVPLDATAVQAFARERGYSTYFNLCYLFTRAMQAVEDFRYRLVDDQLVLYDHLNFSATVPADEGPYGFARFHWEPDLVAANEQAGPIMERARRQVCLEDPAEGSNWVFFSALPKVGFSALSHVRPNAATAGEPRVSFGRFTEHDGRLLLPAGLMVNHVFIDGGALGELFERVEALFADPCGYAGATTPLDSH